MSSEKLNPYGLDLSKFPKIPSQIEIELLYIANAKPMEFGGLDRAEHIKNAIKILWPWVWKYWHEWNDLCLWAWCNYEEIGATGCAAAHKTFTFSLLSELEWLAKPSATAVVLTSTTIGALRGRIWSEFKKFYETSTVPFGYNVVDSMQKIQFKQGEDKFAIRGIAVNSGDIEKAVGNIQGIHPARMVMVIDEAAQTPPAIYTARANLRVGTTFYRCVAIANASDPFDGHGRFCEPKNGWSSISVNNDHWETKSGICLHFDGLKSPNVVRKRKAFPSLFSQTEIDSCRTDFGENSLEWWSYVRGFWAPKGVRNTVMDASMIFDGKADQKAIWEGSKTKIYGALDPSFTTGGDRCVLRFAKAGNFMDGRVGLEFYKPISMKLVESVTYPMNYQIADFVRDTCREMGCQPEEFSADATSASGLMDIMSQRWSSAFRRVPFGGAPTDGPVSLDDEREAKTVYGNRVTQLWFTSQKMVVAGRVRGLDEETSKEFCTRQYTLKNEKIVIEPKSEMKKRTGGVSPDFADPAALICDHVTHDYGNPQSDSSGSLARSVAWEEMARKFNLKSNYAETN